MCMRASKNSSIQRNMPPKGSALCLLERSFTDTEHFPSVSDTCISKDHTSPNLAVIIPACAFADWSEFFCRPRCNYLKLTLFFSHHTSPHVTTCLHVISRGHMRHDTVQQCIWAEVHNLRKDAPVSPTLALFRRFHPVRTISLSYEYGTFSWQNSWRIPHGHSSCRCVRFLRYLNLIYWCWSPRRPRLYGTGVAQAYIYWLNSSEDSALLKATVGAVVSVQAPHLPFILHILIWIETVSLRRFIQCSLLILHTTILSQHLGTSKASEELFGMIGSLDIVSYTYRLRIYSGVQRWDLTFSDNGNLTQVLC